MNIERLIPLLFVFLWSTGFIGSKWGSPYAEPATFLLVRMIITASILLLFLPINRRQWPTKPVDYLHSALVGILIHGVYLGGVFKAIHMGVDAGLSALVVCLQPVLTVVLAALFLSESLGLAKILGVITGFVGAVLVVTQTSTPMFELTGGLLFCLLSLIGITVGTLYQKRFCTGVALIPGVTIQYIGTILFLAPLAYTFESMHIEWAPDFIFALVWLVLVLSLGAVALLMLLIDRGEAGKVASLFYLVPPLVAVEAWYLFDEELTPLALVGIVITAVGVMLVMQQKPSNQDA